MILSLEVYAYLSKHFIPGGMRFFASFYLGLRWLLKYSAVPLKKSLGSIGYKYILLDLIWSKLFAVVKI